MKKMLILLTGILLILVSCEKTENVAETGDPILHSGNKESPQAVSLTGKPLYPSTPSEELVKKYEDARAEYEENPDNADAIIWYGRRTAYLGGYKEAIRIFSEGIEKFPADARFYRHRGHRHISIRQFDNAISDLGKAAELIQGHDDEIEPDGMPNAQNIPVSTLHGNIWYHLGLAYYLKNDMENALRVYRQCINVSKNDDMLAATTHWLYMTLRRLGMEEEAEEALAPVHSDMNVIENMAYHNLCLFYKGEIPMDSLLESEFSSIMNDAVAYGVGNWYACNGRPDKARETMLNLLEREGWASFGYIAAEADIARESED